MTIIVFAGPTLRADEFPADEEFVVLPPVAQGDVYRAAQRRPRAIGIVDGYFSGAPSVWHKEILWAISNGIPVYGSASMGALRAAELHGFGMRGVGRIFEAFRDGVLEDDDEVAVVHGPAELGYLQASEAMVNIRATLARAAAETIIGPAARRALEALAKSLFFPHRSWQALLDATATPEASEAERTALSVWLPQGRIDQKRLDALEMLAAMQARTNRDEATAPKFNFEWTYFWDEFVRGADPDTPESSRQRAVLDELRLEGPEAYRRVEVAALLRKAGVSGARPAAAAIPREALQATLTQIRAKFGLYARADLDRWMALNDLDATALEKLVADEAELHALRDRSVAALDPYIVSELQMSGDYARLAERARRKREALAALSVGGAAGLASSRSLALRLWFFEQRLGRPMPDDVEDFLRGLGFADAAAFDAVLHRERLYLDAEKDHEKA